MGGTTATEELEVSTIADFQYATTQAIVDEGLIEGISLHVTLTDGAKHWGLLEDDQLPATIEALLGATLTQPNTILGDTVLAVNAWLNKAKEELADRVEANR